MSLEGNNGEMEFLVNRAALFPVVSVSSPPPTMQGSSHRVGFTLVDFGFMSHFSTDAVGATHPVPSMDLVLSRGSVTPHSQKPRN